MRRQPARRAKILAMQRTREAEHERFERRARERGLLRPPPPPGPGECCGRHCDPCVWDYYERALERWRERHGLES
jgi:hypothetical protein